MTSEQTKHKAVKKPSVFYVVGSRAREVCVMLRPRLRELFRANAALSRRYTHIYLDTGLQDVKHYTHYYIITAVMSNLCSI